MRRATAGFVSSAFTELMIFVTIAGVAAAVFVPKLLDTRRSAATHECAVRIDTLEPHDVASTCPVSAKPYTLDVETGKHCCPIPEKHKVEQLCRLPDGPLLADTHKAPSRARWLATGVLGGVSGGAFALLALGMIALSVWDSFNRKRPSP